MPGLVPGIHVFATGAAAKTWDGRDKPGHDAEIGSRSGPTDRSLKILTAAATPKMLPSPGAIDRQTEMETMTEKTCAACDGKLDADVIRVTVGGKTVEVCCRECADALKEAHASTTGKEG
jgi:hypothetical protein